MKKVLVVLLSLCMVLGCFSFAFAGTYTDVADTADYAEAVEVLSGIGILEGDGNGKFRPNDGLKRVEACVILVKLLDKAVLGEVQTNTQFSDVPASYWGSGWVATAANLGFIEGYGDGKFGPEDPLTYDQWLTMVLRVMGYKDDVLAGTWPTNFQVKALDLKLVDKNTIGSTNATRGNVAEVAYDALTSDSRIEYDAKGNIVASGADIGTGALIPSFLDAKDDYVKGAAAIVPFGATGILADYVGQYGVTYYTDKDGSGTVTAGDEPITFVADKNMVKLEGTYDGANDKVVVSKTEKYNVVGGTNTGANAVAGAQFIENGAISAAAINTLPATYNGQNVTVYAKVDAADTDASNGLDLAQVYSVDSWVRDAVKQVAAGEPATIGTAYANATKNSTTGNVAVNIGATAYNVAFNKGVGAVDLTDLAVGDVVSVYLGGGTITKFEVSKDTVSGNVTKLVAASGGNPAVATIGGKEYDDINGVIANASATTGEWYLTAQGEIFGVKNAAGPASNYAIVSTVFKTGTDAVAATAYAPAKDAVPAQIELVTASGKRVYAVNTTNFTPSTGATTLPAPQANLNTLAVGDVISFKVDGNDAVTEFTEIGTTAFNGGAADVKYANGLLGTLVPDANMLVFTNTAGKYAIATKDAIPATLYAAAGPTSYASYIQGADNEVDVLVVTVAAAVSNPAGFVTGTVANVLDSDGKTAIFAVDAILDGQKTQLKAATDLFSALSKTKYYTFTLTGGKVAAAADIDAGVTPVTTAVQKINGANISTDGTNYTPVATDAVIYTSVLNSAGNTITGYAVGTMADIVVGVKVQFYHMNAKGQADIIFVDLI